MGHRSSHTRTRTSKRGTPEQVSTYSKDKHDTNDEGSKLHDKSRQEKRDHKRKREHEDMSKKKHKEKYRAKRRRHKTKEKPKEKVSRRKGSRSSENMGSESDHSSGSCHHHHKRSHSCSTDRPREHSHSHNTDIHKNYSLKRFKENAFSMDDFRQAYETPNGPKQAETRQCVNEQLVHMSMQQVLCDERSHVQEKGPDGEKDEAWEVELRQRALANFLRHQDVSCKMVEYKERILPTTNLGVTWLASNNEQSGQEVDNRGSLSSSSNVINVDTPIDASASNVTAHVSQRSLREGSELACNSGSNLEEGEILSDSEKEAGNTNAFCVADAGNVLYDKEVTETGDRQAGRDICEEQDQPRLLNAGKVERLLTEQANVAASCIIENREVSQEHAIEGSLNEDPTTVQHDANSSFQQKTMSVMRGGEMVQVSYKVYIPKRAAELARRRLQR